LSAKVPNLLVYDVKNNRTRTTIDRLVFVLGFIPESTPMLSLFLIEQIINHITGQNY
jgi:hypothetical protein